ncbi:hypothetical protein CNMCM8980_007621 [Aspergillus fumigatiaffinis]|uniref:BZIP domain-containing protein n=1 Tax=Aspergillus fumigatiaffinis TaxID=340414 RepID=A0A8H4HHC7_9EURO|nr:hypothetical protein CNMCM5878_004562 [Aspergillus fumigatiaffinis]KAF4244086.1 hypothetical protein CNMCM6805_009871 [Aspergillus fumigatiaffinis]KAF4251334.1 hypothetical protein CNMCM8980_007621 [Aspergillus fumigatiaffinis]
MNLESDQKVGALEKATCTQSHSVRLMTGQKVDKLARIRENQRRSRARKQEHIRDLEQKLACLQEQAHKQDVEHRLAAQRLEMENRKLRYLLSYSGIPPQTVEEYLRTGDDPAVTQKVAIPALRRSEFESENLRQETKCSRPCGGKSSNTVGEFQNGDGGLEIQKVAIPASRLPEIQPEVRCREQKCSRSCSSRPPQEVQEKPRSTFDPLMTEKVVLPPLQRPEIQPEAPCQETKPFLPCSSSLDRSERDASPAAVQNQLSGKDEPSVTPEPSGKTTSQESQDPSEQPRLPPLCDCAPEDNEAECFPNNGDALNTTLCAIADELIQQYNTRGMDITEIRKRLWAGFSKGLTTEEGCRVQNQILFQVLDEISNH